MGAFQARWAQVQTSLWFLPALLTVGAMLLAAFTVWLDQRGFAATESGWFMLVAGAEGARGVLSTVAGSIITVTGVVFSITIVVLQLASSQYSPRVLRSFTEDRVNHLVLGVFIGTFTYALLVLRTVRSEFADYDRFVPTLSVNTAVALALLSIGFLIYFINHIARSIQAETIIARVTADALEVVERLFPQQLGTGAPEEPAAEYWAAAPRAVVYADRSGFVQSVQAEQMLQLADRHDLLLRLETHIGAFVLDGDALISIIGGSAERLPMRELRQTVVLGPERTRFQDVERGLIELTDIAVRALSPGINDPTTARVCVHRLTEIFAQMGMRRFPPIVRKGAAGSVRVVAPRAHFAELVTLAYGQIRAYARGHPAVIATMTESLQRLLARLPAERQPAVRRELERVSAET